LVTTVSPAKTVEPIDISFWSRIAWVLGTGSPTGFYMGPGLPDKRALYIGDVPDKGVG